MMRISRILYVAWIAILPFTLAPATIAVAQTATVPELTSSGLLTFSAHDSVIRVAIVFARENTSVVDATVRFIDATGAVLKTRRANLSYGAPIIAELSRSDVGGRDGVLVRAEVLLNLPAQREVRHPILISLQTISGDGIGRYLVTWNGGGCGCPTSGSEPTGRWASCIPPTEAQPELSPG